MWFSSSLLFHIHGYIHNYIFTYLKSSSPWCTSILTKKTSPKHFKKYKHTQNLLSTLKYDFDKSLEFLQALGIYILHMSVTCKWPVVNKLSLTRHLVGVTWSLNSLNMCRGFCQKMLCHAHLIITSFCWETRNDNFSMSQHSSSNMTFLSCICSAA